MATILVTGATGTTGSKLVERLVERGADVRVGVRSLERTADLERAGARAVRLDFHDASTLPDALAGCERVYYIVPQAPDPVAVTKTFLSAAKTAGVRHVVKVSGLHCTAEPTIAFGRIHRATERVLEESGLGWTFLRPNNFMDNFLTGAHSILAPDARGELRVPWGDGACSFIASDDIANVAAVALTTEGHDGKAYELTGPKALSIAEAAAIIAKASERHVHYVNVTEDETRRALAAKMPARVVEMVMEIHAFGKLGRTATVTTDIGDVTARDATTFEAFARKHAQSWRTPAVVEVAR